jgi:hypothetical protein
MAFFHSFPSYKSTTSITVLGSSSAIIKEKIEYKSSGVYLSSFLLSRTELLDTEVS